MSVAMEELSCKYVAYGSYRVSADLLNETLFRVEQSKQMKSRTMCDLAERVGKHLKEALDSNSQEILKRHNFYSEEYRSEIGTRLTEVSDDEGVYALDRVRELADEYNQKRTCLEERIHETAIRRTYEKAGCTTYFCGDDIGVPKQKEQRKKGKKSLELSKTGRKKKHYVENTVVSVHAQDTAGNSTKTEYFAGVGMKSVFEWSRAYMISHGYIARNHLVVFTDGAKNIRSNLQEVFGFRPYTVMLDWYHLCKKIGEYLSMGMRNRIVRNDTLEKLQRILWAGNVDEAIHFVENIDQKMVKSSSYMNSIIAYLEKHRNEIPCYALRSMLGLRNASQAVESANFFLVADRQKVGGMSWSFSGSEALSLIRTLFENNESQEWFHDHTLAMFQDSE